MTTLPLEVKSKFLDVCVDLCCLDIRPFSGKGILHLAQTLIIIGAKYDAVDTDAIIPHRQTFCDRTKQQAEKLSEVIQKEGIYSPYMSLHQREVASEKGRILATVEFDSHLKKKTTTTISMTK